MKETKYFCDVCTRELTSSNAYIAKISTSDKRIEREIHLCKYHFDKLLRREE